MDQDVGPLPFGLEAAHEGADGVRAREVDGDGPRAVSPRERERPLFSRVEGEHHLDATRGERRDHRAPNSPAPSEHERAPGKGGTCHVNATRWSVSRRRRSAKRSRASGAISNRGCSRSTLQS